MRGVVVCSLVLLASPAFAQVRTPASVPIEGAAHLERFAAAWQRAASGGAPLRVLVLGASHTAGDQYTSVLRTELQAVLGDAGPGFVMPAPPFPLQGHAQVSVSGQGWTGRKIRGRERRLDDYGYAGFFLESRGAARATLRSRQAFDHLELFVESAAPTRVAIEVDGARVREVTVEGASVIAATVPDGPHRMTLRTEGALRVYGVALERRRTGGAIVDALGVPGARLWDQERWRDARLREHIARRPPDLVVLAYGTNEAANRRVPIDEVRARYVAALRRWRELAPSASLALLGPGDWPRRRAGGVRGPRPRLEAIVRAQRAAAAEANAAFLDVFAWMGGRGSMLAFVEEGLALDDHVHFTDAGYGRLGDALFVALRRAATQTGTGRRIRPAR